LLNALIADSNTIFRKGIIHILSGTYSPVKFNEVNDIAEVLPLLRKEKYDILILDMMPSQSGLLIAKQLKEEQIPIPVLALSFHPDKHLAIRAFKSGVSGYLAKDASESELLKAVELLLAKRKYIPQTVVEEITDEIQNGHEQPLYKLLSDREFQTLLLMASGKTTSEIAKNLSLSVTTVSTYRTRILEKMRMRTSAELINYAIRNHLV
jgi:DNA-binding NarL/FixJ family response regulator